MLDPTRRPLPWLLVVAFGLFTAAGFGLKLANASPLDEMLFSPVFASYAIAGAVLVARVPRNAVGWLLLATGEAAGIVLIASEYSILGIARSGLPLHGVAVWLSFWIWIVMLAPLVLILFLFPDGTLPSRRWRPVLVAVIALLGASAAAFAFGTPADAVRPELGNPLFIASVEPLYRVVEASFILYLGCFVAGVAALVTRYRRARGAARQQMKWFALAAVYALTGIAAGGSQVVPKPFEDLLWASAVAALPVAMAVAILRYRLYDIDVLINRTLVYVALTVTLGAAYIGSVIGTQAVLAPLTGGNEIAVAASTLLVVALFQPLRRRIQRAVDRRFYRSRYDAQRTLDEFAARLRDEVDLGALEQELLSVIDQTLQPAVASMWLRERGMAKG